MLSSYPVRYYKVSKCPTFIYFEMMHTATRILFNCSVLHKSLTLIKSRFNVVHTVVLMVITNYNLNIKFRVIESLQATNSSTSRSKKVGIKLLLLKALLLDLSILVPLEI